MSDLCRLIFDWEVAQVQQTKLFCVFIMVAMVEHVTRQLILLASLNKQKVYINIEKLNSHRQNVSLLYNDYFYFILDEMPVCGGDWQRDHNKCEVFEISKNQWKNINSYPFD